MNNFRIFIIPNAVGYTGLGELRLLTERRKP